MSENRNTIDELQEAFIKYTSIVNKERVKYFELWDAVEWYFETREMPLFKRRPSKEFPGLFTWRDAVLEFNNIKKHADQQLRKYI